MESYNFSAGAAKLAIPFPDDFFPYRAWGPRCLTGEHDELCVRALYLRSAQPLLIVVVEAGDIDPAWTSRLAQVTALAEDQVFISATHTHTAPYIGGYWPEQVRDVEKSALYTKNAWDTVVSAAKQAMSNPRPAHVRINVGTCSVNVNRDVCRMDPETGKPVYSTGQNFHGYSDKRVFSLLFSAEDDTPIAVLFNYAVHSSVLFGTNQKDGGQLASGDLAGSAMRQVEATLGHHCVAMFAMAPAADQDPRYSGSYMYLDGTGNMQRRDYGLGAYALSEALARELSSEVQVICESGAALDATNLASRTGTVWVPGKVKKEGHGVPRPTSPADFEPSEPVPVPIGVIRLDTTVILAVGCEITTAIGIQLETAVKAMGYDNVFIITQCNGSSSYMADDKSYEKITFTAIASHMMPGASDCLTQGIVKLLSAE